MADKTLKNFPITKMHPSVPKETKRKEAYAT